MSKFRVDKDSAGNPEVSAPKARKLKPLDDEEVQPKSALKSAMKGGGSSAQGTSKIVPATPPKSALKSALKSSPAPPPEPDEEPPAVPLPPPKSAIKSAMKRPKQTSEDCDAAQVMTPKRPEGNPPVKSALKQGGSQRGSQKVSAAKRYSSEHSQVSSGGDSRSSSKKSVASNCRGRSKARPSCFKMTTDIADLHAWTATGLARHYFHYTAQLMAWEQAVHIFDESSSTRGSRKSIRVSELLQEKPKSEEKVEVAHDAISPLKDLLLEKKPDEKKVRELLLSLPPAEMEKWVNAPLDATPPPMPAPLFFAVAGVHSKIVEVLIELGVDVTAYYPGKSMLKGWVKPNVPLVESVTSRKGRFVGTMLGDKLESIEGMLKKAASKALDGEAKESLKTPQGRRSSYGQNGRRKSVQMKCSQGIIEHNHDHPCSKYELMALHDDGNPSNVREAVNMASGEIYAVKAGSKVDEGGASDPEAALWNEIGIIRKLDHPNIVRLHETFENDTHIFMVLEGCLGGELFDRLVSEGSCGEAASLRLSYQIGSALRHLHQIQICHRDVQPEAFLLAEAGPLLETGVKIVDFSSAKEFSSDQRMFTKVCTLHYVAPEIVYSSSGYTEKVDIWSFGVLLFTMICGAPPFHAANEMDTLAMIKDGTFEFAPAKIWNDVSDDTKDLISKCLTKDPDKRCDTWAVMEHPCMLKAEASGAVYVASERLGRENSDSTGERSADMMASYIIKTTFSMMAEVLSDEQVDQLRSMFNGIDEDGQGMIELEDAVEQIKSMIKDNPEAADLMKVICTGGITGRVNYLMYMATMTDRRRQLRREAARAVFNHFDIDKNGNVSLYEVAQALLKDDGIRISKVTQVSLKEIEKIWQEMRDVFVVHKGQQLSDREMSFDEFFKQLPSSSLDIGF